MEPILYIICSIFFFVCGITTEREIPAKTDRIVAACLIVLCIMCLTMSVCVFLYE